MRSERRDSDENALDDGQQSLCSQAVAHRTAEVDQQQHREGAKGREGRNGRVADDLVAEGEHPGHDDRRAPGAAERHQAGITGAEPRQRMQRHSLVFGHQAKSRKLRGSGQGRAIGSWRSLGRGRARGREERRSRITQTAPRIRVLE